MGPGRMLSDGLWGMDSEGRLNSVFPRSKPHDPPGRIMPVDDITEVKRSIVRVGKDLRKFVDATKSVALAWPRKPRPTAQRCPPDDEG